MALNCIVDDSALVAGIRDHTKDNLKQWISDGAINLFVPLYTLEQLNVLRSKNVPTSNDARKALEWLDHITSWTENKQVGRVELQGPDDQYKTWSEVEKYLLPDTPFSAHNASDRLDDASVHRIDRLSIDEVNQGNGSAGKDEQLDKLQRPTSSGLDGTADARPIYSSPRSTMNIPQRVRPLLNFVVWRTHHQDTTVQATAQYILLTDDTVTQKQAQKFGVRAKLLSQVRSVVARDRSRLGITQTTVEDSVLPEPEVLPEDPLVIANVDPSDGEDEEEVVYKPVNRPLSSHSAKQEPYVWDPDHFGRTQNPVPEVTQADAVGNPMPTTRGNTRAPTMPRGGRFPRGSLRGRPTNARGSTAPRGSSAPKSTPRGDNPPRSPRAANAPVRGAPTSPRRFPTSPRTRAAAPAGRQPRGQNPSNPIDPDSYARPPPNGRGRGRTGYRRLWEPT